MRRTLRPVATATVAVTLGSALVAAVDGCFAITELDRFYPKEPDAAPEAGQADDPTRPSSLVLTLVNMGVHFQQYIEARVIDDENAIQSLVMIKPLDELGKDRITIHVPGAIPSVNGPYRLDFYADVNDSGTYDGIGNVLLDDHAWRIEPLADHPGGTPHVANVVEVTFLHSKSFTDIDKWPTGQARNPPSSTGLSARVAFVGGSLGPYRGRLLQVRVEESRTGHTVGTYRIPQIPTEDLVITMPGVLDIGADYAVNVYIDANGNNRYDAPGPGGDLGFALPIRSSVDGGVADGGPVFGIDLTLDVARTELPSNVDVGEP